MNKTPLIMLSTVHILLLRTGRKVLLTYWLLWFTKDTCNGHQWVVGTEEASVGATGEHNEKYVEHMWRRQCNVSVCVITLTARGG